MPVLWSLQHERAYALQLADRGQILCPLYYSALPRQLQRGDTSSESGHRCSWDLGKVAEVKLIRGGVGPEPKGVTAVWQNGGRRPSRPHAIASTWAG